MSASEATPRSTPPFVHFGARSEASFSAAISRVEELCWEAGRDEQGFLALTDLHSLAQAPAFAAEAARQGLRPIFGIELAVTPLGADIFRGELRYVRLVVEEQRGWRNAIRLVNLAAANSVQGKPPHVTTAQLLDDPRGLVIFLRDELAQLVRAREFERIEELVNRYRDAADKDRLWIELPAPTSDVSKALAQQVAEVARFFKLPAIAVPKVCAAHQSDDTVQRIFFSNERLAGSAPLAEFLPAKEKRSWLLTRAQAAKRYAGFEEALARSYELAQQCSRFSIPTVDRRFPVHDFQRGVDAESFLWNTAFARATERYGELSSRVKERLNREFREIVDAGLANAVVTLVRLHEEMENDGIQRGPGAGLFTNSVIASLMGLTRFDPLQFDLNFELSPGIASGPFPLLELSVPANQEALAFDTLQRLFDGQILPVGERRLWKTNSILERLSSTLGHEQSWVTQTMRTAPFQKAREHATRQPATWMPDSALTLESPEVLGWLCARMEGRLRDYHAVRSAYVFSVDPIDSQVPALLLSAGAESGAPGLPVSQWNGEVLGKLRHGRLSFTHPPLLDLIGEATMIAREQGDPAYSPERTAPDDKPTYELLRAGRTVGIEPLERPSLRRLLRETQPEDLHALIRHLRGVDGRSGLELSTILLIHVCAAIKATHPGAFYAAALSHAASNQRRIAALLDEVREAEIPIAPIDVNLSALRWSYEKNVLRPGLMVIRGMTQTAAHELLTKRRELPFSDLADLCQRTERAVLRAPQIRALVHAGAFDDLGKSREEIITQLDVLLPARAAKKPAEEELTLFANDPTLWSDATAREESATARRAETTPPTYIPEVARLADALPYLNAAKVRLPGLLPAKEGAKPATLIGSLGPVETDEKGSIAICDVGGCLVRATGPLAALLADDDYAGRKMLFTGHLEKQGNQWRLEASMIDTVEEAYRRGTSEAELILDLSLLPPERYRGLLWLLKAYPGKTPIAMEWMPAESPSVLRSIASRRVLLCPLLEYQLRKDFGDVYRIRELDATEAAARANGQNSFMTRARDWLAQLLRPLAQMKNS